MLVSSDKQGAWLYKIVSSRRTFLWALGPRARDAASRGRDEGRGVLDPESSVGVQRISESLYFYYSFVRCVVSCWHE